MEILLTDCKCNEDWRKYSGENRLPWFGEGSGDIPLKTDVQEWVEIT